jgi:hypothetical protein
VSANKYIGLEYVELGSYAFRITSWAPPDVRHEKFQALNFPMKMFLKFGTNLVVINVSKDHPIFVRIESSEGVCHLEISDVAGMPDFIAIRQVVCDSIIPMAVCI